MARNVDERRDMVSDFVNHYNHRRLHSVIGYVTPAAFGCWVASFT
ncbi:MAG: hypothetical protein Tsb0020_31720 [Haliangiales bacterium]